MRANSGYRKIISGHVGVFAAKTPQERRYPAGRTCVFLGGIVRKKIEKRSSDYAEVERPKKVIALFFFELPLHRPKKLLQLSLIHI